ncbi:sugar acetyltransferase [Paramagnetospirillum kuznetsovii]|uniref:Sugar acetyltransferase n=1 Tax=Paramagnetospirillum kuznetsovii TaxID=2053833 RepID=A0A364P305_9PROT|nr:acetyltransferase [Paramagnetospirillum kuznetsovii]RAU23547.1 sugar acetyltransferase [Paramagnetospirillum kuznetsovii]
MTFDPTKPVILLGAGGHAKVLLASLRRLGAQVLGSADRDGGDLGIPCLGGDEAVLGHSPDEVQLVNGIGSIAPGSARQRVFESFRQRGYRFATIVDPHAVVAEDVRLGEGVQIMAGAVIQPGCAIGDNAIVNTRAAIDHDCTVGAHAHVAPGVTLSGDVTVGEDAHMGIGACVIQGIAIGASALVAAGAVVIAPVAADASVKGVPARPFHRGKP